MRKESIFDLYNEQHKDDKQDEPERLPEEVAPTDIPETPEVKAPAAPPDPEPETEVTKEGENGLQ